MEAVQSPQMAVRRPMMSWRWQPLLMRLLLFMLVGGVITVGIVFALSLWGAPETGVEAEGAAAQGGRLWQVNTFNSGGSMRLISRREAPSWSAWQVTGPPDT